MASKVKESTGGVKTVSGISLEPYYKAPNSELPGQFPYTRGVHETMYRSRLWTMRQYAGFGTAKEANERYHYLLKHGTTGLSVAFDLPTQMGRDSDHAISKGEVGKVGVAISSTEDMETLLKGIPLGDVSISMTINATAGILLSFLLAVAKKQGVPWEKLNGTIQNDVLKEYIARGTYIYPVKPALKVVTDIIAFCGDKVPKWNTVSISGYHIREAGSTAVQEIAFSLADGIAYVDAAIKAGLKVDDFGERLAFFFNCHNEFLEEIAKFRAARKLWAIIMKERFGAKNPRAMMLRFHTQTAGSSLTAQQPLNNVVRTTIQAMAAVLGGTQSLHTNSFDEALCLPTEQAATIALRTQQIIAHESGVSAVADPFGGSYLIEDLTDRLVKEANDQIEKIDKMGGMLAAIDKHYPQNEIERAAYDYQREIEQKKRIIVGQNEFIAQNEEVPPMQKLDPKGEEEQCKRLAEYRSSRNEIIAKKAMANLKRVAKDGGNVMAVMYDGADSALTLGEISDCLREVFGEYKEG